MKIHAFGLLFLLAAGPCHPQDTTGTVVVISEKIGPVIDLKERNDYRIFMSIHDFQSAVLYMRPDSSFAFQVFWKNPGETTVRTEWIPSSPKEAGRIRGRFETYTGASDSTASAPDSIGIVSKRLSIRFSVSGGIMLSSQINSWKTDQDACLGVMAEVNSFGLEYGAAFLRSTLVLSINLFLFVSRNRSFQPFVTAGLGECTKHKDEAFINAALGARFRIGKRLFGRAEYRNWSTFGEGSASFIQLGMQVFLLGA